MFSSQDLKVILVSKHPLGQFLQVDATENEDFDAESPIRDRVVLFGCCCALEQCINLGHIGLRKTLDH